MAVCMYKLSFVLYKYLRKRETYWREYVWKLNRGQMQSVDGSTCPSMLSLAESDVCTMC